MAKESANPSESPAILQSDFEQITRIVSAQFQTDDALLEHGVPTCYLKQPQETKQAFLKALKGLEPMKLRMFSASAGSSNPGSIIMLCLVLGHVKM